MPKAEYWSPAFDDALALIAALPARIHRNVYRPGEPIAAPDANLDLVGNYTAMLGRAGEPDLAEYLRLYIALHADHEGGNASAHTARACLRLGCHGPCR
jgi:citrate synthase